MNRLEETKIAAEEVKAMVEEGTNKKLIRDYHHLIGLVELKRGNYEPAIEQLEKALVLYPYKESNFRFLLTNPLAKAYYQSGDLEKAQGAYENIMSLRIGRYWSGDIYVKSYYMLGKIWEKKGDIAKAIEYYEKFLQLWKNADPGLPEVEDARNRLVELKSQPDMGK
jgi:stress-induced-phosphoprotein 1